MTRIRRLHSVETQLEKMEELKMVTIRHAMNRKFNEQEHVVAQRDVCLQEIGESANKSMVIGSANTIIDQAQLAIHELAEEYHQLSLQLAEQESVLLKYRQKTEGLSTLAADEEQYLADESKKRAEIEVLDSILGKPTEGR